jgi:hypothetical protein
MGTQVYRSAEAFATLLDTLREASETYLGPERGLAQEVDVAEGYRYLLHLVSAGIDFYLEGDPEHPEFVRMVSPARKLGGDNPDAIYHFTRIRGDRTYRITGRKDRECYLSFTIHGRISEDKLGMSAEPVLADVNDRNMKVAADGSFEVVLSPHEHPGNWLKLDPSAAAVIVRHYFELEHNVAADPTIKIELGIEPLDPPSARSTADDGIMARRIKDVAAFVRGASIEMIDMASVPVPFVSRVPNELPQPSGFRSSGQAVWGAVDIAYAMAPFCVGPDEALVMEGTLPKCAFANVVLWNKHMQTFEFRGRRVSLNRKQIVFESDGSYRIVVAHSDPGVPNWLDTEGHTDGTIFWRLLLPEGEAAKPKCTLVRLADIRK